MSRKRRGYEAELRAKHDLMTEGFLVVRSSASLTPFDLVAIREDIIKFIQVKRQKLKGKYDKDIEQMKKIKIPINTQKELWIWTDKKSLKGWKKEIID